MSMRFGLLTAVVGVTISSVLVVTPTNAVAGEAVTLSAGSERKLQEVDSDFNESTGVTTVLYSLYRKNYNFNGNRPGYIQHTVRSVSVGGKAIKVGSARQLPNGMTVERPSRTRLRLKVQAPTQTYPHWQIASDPITSCSYVGTDGNTYNCLYLDEYFTDYVRYVPESAEPRTTWASTTASSEFEIEYNSIFRRSGKMGTPGHWDCSIYRREVCKWIPRKPGTPSVRRDMNPLTIRATLGVEFDADLIATKEPIGSYSGYRGLNGPVFYQRTVNGVFGAYDADNFRLPGKWPAGFEVRDKGYFEIYAPTYRPEFSFWVLR